MALALLCGANAKGSLLQCQVDSGECQKVAGRDTSDTGMTRDKMVAEAAAGG